MNVMWEDTGRAHGSSIGPNITDLTLQVRYQRGGAEDAALMPVIRFPNFADRTGDVPASKLFVRVGNHRNAKDLKTVRKPINARSETVTTSPMFRSAFGKRRCIIPASAFYEWKASQGGKEPFAIARLIRSIRRT